MRDRRGSVHSAGISTILSYTLKSKLGDVRSTQHVEKWQNQELSRHVFPFFQKSFVLESPLPASITGMRNESTHWDRISICECAMLLSGSFCSVIKLYKVCCNTVIIFISHSWMQHCFKIWQLNISQIHENIQWEQFTTCLFTYKFLTAPEWIVSVSSL